MNPAARNPATQGQGVSTDEALALAHVRKVKAFYIHLAQYVFVIVSLTIANLVVSPQYLWVLWVAAGWGLGVLFDGLRVFDKLPFQSAEWERRQVENILAESFDVRSPARAAV